MPHMYTAVYLLAPDAAVFDTSQKKLITVLVWGRENAIFVARYDSMIPGTYRCVVYAYHTIGTTVCSEKLYYLLLFWSRLVHSDLAMHATLAALAWARSATCKPCHMVLVPNSTVHCSRPPARNLDLSSSDHALGPWVEFIYILPCYASHMM